MRYLSFQKLRSSSIVLAAPRILASSTSTPASFEPQKALQKSRELEVGSGEPSLAYFERDVVDACRLADMADGRARSTLNRRPPNAPKRPSAIAAIDDKSHHPSGSNLCWGTHKLLKLPNSLLHFLLHRLVRVHNRLLVNHNLRRVRPRSAHS